MCSCRIVQIVHKCLDACSMDVVQQFFNHLWQFMDMYQQGLMGKAAKWAIYKQKLHQQVGQQAMIKCFWLKTPKGACNIAHFQVARMFKPKNHRKDQTRVFLDVFSLPENESRVHFPKQILDPSQIVLLCFAVQYCIQERQQIREAGSIL